MFMWTSYTNECKLETLWNQWLNIICQEWQYQRNTTIETIYRIRYEYKTYHENIVDNFIIITVHINMTWLIDKYNCKVVFNFNCVVSNQRRNVHDKIKPLFNIWIFFLQIIFLCEMKRTFNVNKILNVHEKYKAIEIYVKTTCVRNNYGLNTKKQNTEGTIRLIYIP